MDALASKPLQVGRSSPMNSAQTRLRTARLGLFGVLGCLAVALSVVVSGPAAAQTGERIVSYDVNIAIQPDGRMLVVERIDYDFSTNEHHGIFRDIRNRFAWDRKSDRVYPIHVLDVVGSPGTPDGYKMEHQGALYRIKIGDA